MKTNSRISVDIDKVYDTHIKLIYDDWGCGGDCTPVYYDFKSGMVYPPHFDCELIRKVINKYLREKKLKRILK